ncbi:hypothetical protein BKA65DRAFT_575610 [Rhexocercosporidium sp. MPI-PUGE-AT-0058]|nr:hypothetical protein BKA65DRAFT_575610 [Rhexocercosporidium sp. MPI-PUGE-AT-0058]
MEESLTRRMPQQQKLRSSCDGCASSKIRCEKQQPTCSRCQQLNQECIYGRSRRRGKPVSKLLQPTTTFIECSVHPAWDYKDALHNSTNQIDYNTWQSSNSHEQVNDDFHLAPSWDGGDANFAADTADNGNTSSLFPLTGTFPGAALNWAAETNEQVSSSSLVNFSASESPPTHCSASATSNTTSLKEDLAEFDTLLPTIHFYGNSSCITKAFTTLSSLYQLAYDDSDTNAAASSTSNNSSNSPKEFSSGLSSDRVLFVARGATQKLGELLNCTCTACFYDSNMFFVLCNLAIKLLSWYRSLYNSNIHSICNGKPKGSNVQLSAPNPLLTQTEEALGRSLLTVGILHLPPETELRIRAQLLLCELQPLAQACNALGSRIRGDEEGYGEAQIKETLKGHHQRSVKELSRSLEALCGQLNC